MKKYIPHILILGIMGLIFIPIHFAKAGSIGDIFSIGSAGVEVVLKYFFQIILQAILVLISYVVGFAGLLLNYVLQYTVIDLKVHLQDLTGINIAWKIIRDLMNIAFIFMLVYEGIMLIIGQGNTNQIKKFIIGVVMASLLINFSLFFTKVIIDASNVVTVGFYNNIIGNNAVKAGYGLSDPITKYLGITTVYSTADPSFGAGKDVPGLLIMFFGSGIIILVASFVFFAMTILFIIRYVALLILLMLSPIAYMGMALPGMSSYSKQWWESFKGQLLFAPIFMIMMWVILTLMKSKGFLAISDTSFAAIFTGTNPKFSDFNLILNFVVIIGLLIGSLIVAKSAAKKGSSLIGDATKRLSVFAGGVVAGGTARLSRNTVGRWGNSAANDENLKARAAAGDRFARLKLSTANKAAGSSFDVRANEKFKGLSKATGFDFGKVDPKKENFRAQMEERDKQATKAAERYKPSDLAVQQAKERLASSEFKIDEEKSKKDYLASNEFKNSELSKIQATATRTQDDYRKVEASSKILTQQQKDLKDKLEKQIKLDETMGGGFSQIQKDLSDQLNAKNKEIENSAKRLDELKKTIETTADYEEKIEQAAQDWTFKEKQALIAERDRLIAIAGGTKKEKGKGGIDVFRDAAGNEVLKEIKSAYEQRTSAEAARIENRSALSALWRVTANTLGTVTNVAGITSTPRTKTDRQNLAIKVRKLSSKKSAEQEAKELVKKMRKEAKEKGEKFDDDEDDTPATTAPENPPAEETTEETT